MNAHKFNRLLQKLKTDKRALDEIYREYYPVLVMHLNRVFGRLVSAEDIAQNVFLSLMETETAEAVKHPTGWMCKLSEYKAVDDLKRRHVDLPLSPKESVPFDLDNLILSADMQEAFSLLDPETQEIVYMRFWEGYTAREIAEAKNMSLNCVRMRIFRALKTLEKIF